MKISYCGVRGSIPRPLSRDEIYERIAANAVGGSISLSKLSAMKKNGGLGYGGNTSCTLAEHGDKKLIIDAGSGLRGLSQSFLASNEPIDILLTHLHWDHIQGIPFFIPFYQPGRVVNLYCPISAREVKRVLSLQDDSPMFPVPFKALTSNIKIHTIDTTKSFKIGPFSISSMPVHHPQPAWSFKVKAGGKSYVHISDTEVTLLNEKDSALYQKFVKGADLVSVDSQFNFKDAVSNLNWGHSCFDYFLELFSESNIKKLAFFHYDPQSDDKKVDHLIKQARKLHKLISPKSQMSILPAIEGDTITL